jgi:hypothetical protein
MTTVAIWTCRSSCRGGRLGSSRTTPPNIQHGARAGRHAHVTSLARKRHKCYLIPVGEVDGCSTISLRLEPTRNNQAAKVRWASDYEMERSIRQMRASREPSVAATGADRSVPLEAIR